MTRPWFGTRRWWLAAAVIDLGLWLAPAGTAKELLRVAIGAWAKECRERWVREHGPYPAR